MGVALVEDKASSPEDCTGTQNENLKGHLGDIIDEYRMNKGSTG